MAAVDIVALICGAGLFAVWFLYPAAIGLVAAVRPRVVMPPEPAQDEWPHISIVLATRDTESATRNRIRNLLESRYPADRLEIVVAYDRSAGAPSISADEGVRLVVVPGDEPGGKAASLNAAMRMATGEIIVFADICQLYDADTLPHLVAAFQSPGTGAVTGGYRLAEGTGKPISLYWSFERWLRRTEARVHSSVGATGAVYAIRRTLWKPLPTGLILDDVYTPMKVVLAGLRVAVADDALALETRTPTPRQEYGRKVRTLTGVMQLCAWLPAVLVPVRNPIWVQFMFHKVLRLLTPYFVLAVALWAGVRLGTSLGPASLVVLGAIAATSGLWLAVSGSRTASRVRRILVEALLIQAAVLVAGFNGVRGRWQVWDA